MNYIRIHVVATGEEQEILLSELTDFDAIGFEQGDDFLLAYFPENDFRSYEINEVLKGRKFEITTVAEKNWNEEWESNFQPVTVDDFCGIRAHFHPAFTGIKHEILITPKMSFGTGHHATTFMMIKQMRDIRLAGKKVLDFGTGTGVLAILAEKLGAVQISAIDNDPWSIENARENAANNYCSRINLALTEEIPLNTYDIILANINRNIILRYLPVLSTLLADNGLLLASGLLKADEDIILQNAVVHGLNRQKRLEKDNWISLLFSNQPLPEAV
jgi:ribosomal protein L11 methyltransferase